jgi:hypothetical protein
MVDVAHGAMRAACVELNTKVNVMLYHGRSRIGVVLREKRSFSSQQLRELRTHWPHRHVSRRHGLEPKSQLGVRHCPSKQRLATQPVRFRLGTSFDKYLKVRCTCHRGENVKQLLARFEKGT